MSEPIVMQQFHVGVDFGQRRDHTAVVVLEQRVVYLGMRDPVYYTPNCEVRMGIRLIERIPLLVGFDTVMGDLERLSQCQEFDGRKVVTALDATSVVGWVVEDVRRREMHGRVYPVWITSGATGRDKDGFWTTPRTELLQTLMVSVEMGRLECGDVPGWWDLRSELASLRRVYGENGMRYETDGEHDDLVFALAMAVWGVQRHPLPVKGEELLRKMRQLSLL